MGRNKRMKRLAAYFKKEGKKMDYEQGQLLGPDVAPPAYEPLPVEPPCHTGNVLAFESSGLSVYGGGKLHELSLHGIDSTWMLIDLADNFPSPIEVEGFGFGRLRSKVEINRLRIKWSDGGVAPLGKEHWLALCEDLREWQRQGGKHVIACCLGGHGRTGTALAILYNLLDGEKDPITKLRQGYCKKAVENDKQVKYVNEITGLSLTNRGSTEGRVVTLPMTGGLHGSGSYVSSNVGKPLVAGSQEKGGEWLSWKDATCEVCGGPAVSGVCLGCNRTQRHCNCPV